MEAERRKVFISHYKGDKNQVDAFISQFKSVFIPKVLGANDNDDFINSSDTSYVMRKIREKYLDDSTVTIVLLGRCTHSRRYVDWEIKSSLQQGSTEPNGLLGILLPNSNGAVHLPPRFQANWTSGELECYARYRKYPTRAEELKTWIEDAFSARTTRKQYIRNEQEMMKYNGVCKVCGVTH